MLRQWRASIQEKVKRNWIRPPTTQPGWECAVVVRIKASLVLNINFEGCRGDAVFKRSVENAVRKSSPLPAAPDPSIRVDTIRFLFRPE